MKSIELLLPYTKENTFENLLAFIEQNKYRIFRHTIGRDEKRKLILTATEHNLSPVIDFMNTEKIEFKPVI